MVVSEMNLTLLQSAEGTKCALKIPIFGLECSPLTTLILGDQHRSRLLQTLRSAAHVYLAYIFSWDSIKYNIVAMQLTYDSKQ